GTTANRSSPVRVGTSTNWTTVVAGTYCCLALARDGSLWAWGDNEYGQLGDGTTANRSSPVRVGTRTDWIVVAAGWEHSLAIARDGSLWAWGWNAGGQLGDGTTTDRSSPVRVGTRTDWIAVAGGIMHSVALARDGSLWAWGFNEEGQLGDGTTTTHRIPGAVGSSPQIAAVTAGSLHSIALARDGSLWAWGGYAQGQLGLGSLPGLNGPELVSLPETSLSDTNPPVVTVTSPSNGATTILSQVNVQGTVTDSGSGTEDLSINGNPVSVSSAGVFSFSVTLLSGMNTITILAWDKAGNKTEKTLTLTYQERTVLVLTIGSTIATKNGATVYLDTAPVITNGRTLVPLRFIAEAFGIDPIWDGTLKTIKLALAGGSELTLQVGRAFGYIQYPGTSRQPERITFDVAPSIVSGRTLVPIRFISEQLGAEVAWDAITRTVTITWKG
ncbi:MAG: stalk domain-containing protein, partial [Caldiserica bacterium]|nr:stalk domain-containing protein [Caldisericota bacterium]